MSRSEKVFLIPAIFGLIVVSFGGGLWIASPSVAISAQVAFNQASDTHQQALAAWAQVVVGALTLTAAVAAAFFAGRAARHTASAANEAKRSADAAEDSLISAKRVSNAELRPWVKIEARLTAFEMTDDSLTIEYELTYSNIGPTVARNIRTKGSVVCASATKISDKIVEEYAKDFHRWIKPRTALLPGDTLGYAAESEQASQYIDRDSSDGSYICAIAAQCIYTSDLDEIEHQTEQSFVVTLAEADPFDRWLSDEAIGRDINGVTLRRFTTGNVS